MKNKRPLHLLALTSGAAALLALRTASAADSTADVLAKIHEANQKEISMGKLAEKQGKDKEVLALAKTIVKDHSEADKKVTAMAKKEKIDLPAAPSNKGADMENMAKGEAFDAHFAQTMLDDHKKTIEDLTKARDATSDAQLRHLITELLPQLKKHEEMAQKLVAKAKL